MPLFQVTRPVLTMVTELVEAKDENDACRQIVRGKGQMLMERQDRPTEDYANMRVSKYEDQPESDGPVFLVERNERYTQTVRVRAKDEKDARHRVKEGEGSEIGHPEYVEAMDSSDWWVKPEKQED